MALFPENYHEITETPLGEPERTECELGVSPLCTNEADYRLGDRVCCRHCYTYEEAAAKQPTGQRRRPTPNGVKVRR